MFGPPSPSRYRRQSAIALNNAAISLLVRGYFHEAAETLGDAVKIMRSAPTRTSETYAFSIEAKNAISIKEIHRAIVRSDKRIALYTGAIATNHEQPMRAEHIVHAISSQDNPAQALELITSHDHCPAAQVAFPMTIDHIESSHQVEEDMRFESATILYNFGIALSCMGNASETFVHGTTSHTFLYRKALRLFQVARMLLCKVHGGGERSNSTYLTIDARFLLLRTVVLYSLADVSISLHLHQHHDVYRRELLQVLHAVNVVQIFLPFLDHLNAAAA
jgi:hypothetical protein